MNLAEIEAAKGTKAMLESLKLAVMPFLHCQMRYLERQTVVLAI
jgi:hypothetical protein